MYNVVTAQTILNDPTAHQWLKESLINALACDSVDALNDAEILTEVLKDHNEDVTAAALVELNKQSAETHTAVYPVPGSTHTGKYSACIVKDQEMGLAIVILIELKDNPGMSITNAYEHIASLIVKEGIIGIKPENIVWFEHYEDKPKSLDKVHLKWSGDRYVMEGWTPVTYERLKTMLHDLINKKP